MSGGTGNESYSQGVRNIDSNRAGTSKIGNEVRQVRAPEETISEVGAHSFWKRVTTAIFGF